MCTKDVCRCSCKSGVRLCEPNKHSCGQTAGCSYISPAPNFIDGWLIGWFTSCYVPADGRSAWTPPPQKKKKLILSSQILAVCCEGNTLHSFIPLAVCLTTDPKFLPNRALHIVRSRASYFRWEYPVLSLRSSNSFLRLLPRLPVTAIPPFIFPSITCCNATYRLIFLAERGVVLTNTGRCTLK
jgi:hypothetical protein